MSISVSPSEVSFNITVRRKQYSCHKPTSFEGVFIAAGEWNTCSPHVSLSAADINLISANRHKTI